MWTVLVTYDNDNDDKCQMTNENEKSQFTKSVTNHKLRVKLYFYSSTPMPSQT